MTRSSTLALALFLGLTSAAVAQTSTTTDTQAPAATQPAPAPATPPAAQPATPPASDQTATQSEMKTDQSKPVDGQIVMQDQNSILASTLIGSTVYTPADETVGDINDVIVGLDGQVQGVVIGVGGFLGLGEKDVAVKMDKLTVQPQDENKNNLRLIMDARKADLEAAPEFKSVAAQNRESEAASPPAPTTAPASGSSSTTNQ